ncbi:IS3 family transposase [Ktedonobacter sp. SOSP1-85]|uniref:IS3 family transposase n=1 Tax=Ktedonobacter sp. SOSP1-85 TaxID=2778367 RepID=UPI0035AE8D8E
MRVLHLFLVRDVRVRFNLLSFNFFATLPAQARGVTFDYIETFYNRVRRHSTLHYLSPLRYELSMS